MNELDELIKQYCPHGVEAYLLADLEREGHIKLGRGRVISKNDLRKFPGNFPVFSSSAVGSGEFGRYGKYDFEETMISWSIDGGGKFFYRDIPKYSLTNVSGWLSVKSKELINIKFLFYLLSNEWEKHTFDYTRKAHPSIIKNIYKVPLPPLPVQEFIAQKLDLMTNSHEQLVEKLKKEDELRTKQYEYYRDLWLTLEDEPRVRLGEC